VNEEAMAHWGAAETKTKQISVDNIQRCSALKQVGRDRVFKDLPCTISAQTLRISVPDEHENFNMVLEVNVSSCLSGLASALTVIMRQSHKTQNISPYKKNQIDALIF